jgi:copper(I)-binding protein
VYATIRNPSSHPAILVGASSPAASHVELHESMTMRGGTMNGMAMPAEGMKPVARLTIPPHGSVILKPGGYHLMVLGLHHPLAAGTHFPVTLRFADGSTAQVRVAVENRAF